MGRVHPGRRRFRDMGRVHPRGRPFGAGGGERPCLLHSSEQGFWGGSTPGVWGDWGGDSWGLWGDYTLGGDPSRVWGEYTLGGDPTGVMLRQTRPTEKKHMTRKTRLTQNRVVTTGSCGARKDRISATTKQLWPRGGPVARVRVRGRVKKCILYEFHEI